MAEVIKHSYSHGCQMQMLARNGRGQTYPSGGQPPVKQHTVDGHPARKAERAIPSGSSCPSRWHLALGVPWVILGGCP